MTESAEASSQREPRAPRRRPRQGKGRMEAFSDGVFAIAITLLVLDLAIPDSAASEHDLLGAIVREWPGYLGYLVSFSAIGVLWLGHNAITGYLEHVDATFLRLNLLLLFFVCLLPFATRLMSEFLAYTGNDAAERVASTAYGLTLLLCVSLLWLLWRYVLTAGLLQPDLGDDELTLLTKRIIPSMVAYAVLIVLGLLVPVAAVIGYFVVAVFLLIPIGSYRRGRRAREAERRRREGARSGTDDEGARS